jgi:hypothetical protein
MHNQGKRRWVTSDNNSIIGSYNLGSDMGGG